MEAQGYRRDYVIPVAGQLDPIVYYRSPAVYGPMLELVPAVWQRSRQAVKSKVEAWTGGDPILC